MRCKSLDIGKENSKPPDFAPENSFFSAGQKPAHEVIGHKLDKRAQPRFHAIGGIAKLVDLAQNRTGHLLRGEVELTNLREIVAEGAQRFADPMGHERSGQNCQNQSRQAKQTHLANCTVNATENDRFRHDPGHDALEAQGCFDVIKGREI